MNYAVWHGWPSKLNGTSLQGYIEISYKELVEKLGKPNDGDGYKVDAEWCVEFEDGTVATIYNYKDGKNYNGSSGTPKTKITDWHIGGNDERSYKQVHALFGRS